MSRTFLIALAIGCSSAHSVAPDAATASSDDAASGVCTSPLTRPALPPLGERRCLGLPAGQTWDPGAPGPYVVGVKTIQIADPLRPGRTLVTEVWYPAADSAKGQPGTGYSILFSDIAAMLGVSLPIPGSIEIIHTDAVRDAPRAPADPATGLVVFSHGFRGVRFQSTFLTIALASHGYIVAAPDHQGNTMFDGSATPEQSARDRTEDMSLVTSEMIARTRSLTDFFAGSFDPRRVGWTGHSFGASTDIMAGVFDNRESVIIPLAPCFEPRMTFVYNPPQYDGRAAAVFIGGTDDTRCPAAEQQLAYQRTVAPRYVVGLAGTKHMDFSDVCTNTFLRLIPQVGDSCGSDPAATQAAVKRLAISALDRYVRCNPAASVASGPGVATFTADPGATPAVDPDPGAQCDLDGADAPLATDVMVSRPTGPPLHVTVRGATDAPPLVFVHGFSMTGGAFQHQLDVLSRRYRVVAIDLRGHGGSLASPDAPFGADHMPATDDDPYRYERFADDVDDVIANLQLVRPIVIGWSSGGQIALEVARRDPARLRGLVIIDATPLMIPDEVAHPMFNGGGTLPFARELRLGLAAQVQGSDTWRALAENLVARGAPSTLVDKLLALLVSVPNATRLGQIGSVRPDLVDALPTIAVSTLVIHGELDDSVLLESARYLAAHLPSAQLEVFQRSGHAPFLEEPERFDLVLDHFVQALAP